MSKKLPPQRTPKPAHTTQVLALARRTADKLAVHEALFSAIFETPSHGAEFCKLVALFERTESAFLADPETRSNDAENRAMFAIGVAVGQRLAGGAR